VLTVHTPLIHTSRLHAAALWLADMILVRPFLAIGRPTIVVVDWFMREYVRRRYHPAESHLRNLLLGIDPDRFPEVDPATARARLGLGDRPVILSIGHVIPLRSRLPLIEALPYLAKEQPDVAVVVVGNVLDDCFLRRAEELGVRDHLIVTGPVARDEVPAYVAAADAECHDLQGYGLGTSTLEVMAAGVPVVAVVGPDNFPGLELRNWESIVMAPPDDPVGLAQALNRVMSDRQLARSVAEGQRHLIRHNFSMERVTEAHLELYGELVGSRSLIGP
jgi:glycosyltransferase involved in cell wall biosynthesis